MNDTDTEDVDARTLMMNVDQAIIDHHDKLRKLPVKSDMDEYFSRDDVRAAFAEHKGLSKAQYDAFVKGMTIQVFIELTKEQRDFASFQHAILLQHRAEIKRLWKWVDAYQGRVKELQRLFYVGVAVAVGGFWLWWRRVQRHEDVILLGKLSGKSAAP